MKTNMIRLINGSAILVALALSACGGGGELAPCGTATACKRHYRNGEKPCEPCRLAGKAAQEEYRRQRRGNAA